jgi:hypothetical protein
MTKHRSYRFNNFRRHQLRKTSQGPPDWRTMGDPASLRGCWPATIRYNPPVSMQVRRLALSALLGLFLLTPAQRIAAQTPGKPAQSSCCQMTSGEKTACAMVSHHCPLKPADATPCCAACLLTLALIDFASVAFVFDDGAGEILKLEDFESWARPARPPYPPPRFV